MFEEARNEIYDSLSKIEILESLIDLSVVIEAVIQLLVQKGIITLEEVKVMSEKVRDIPEYKGKYDKIEEVKKELESRKKDMDKLFDIF